MKARVIKTDESLIYNSKIYTLNDELEIDDSVGKSLVERGYIVEIADEELNIIADEDVEEEPEDEQGINLNAMSYQELKSYAKELLISADGKKEELIERIKDYLAHCEEMKAKDADAGDELPNTAMPE